MSCLSRRGRRLSERKGKGASPIEPKNVSSTASNEKAKSSGKDVRPSTKRSELRIGLSHPDLNSIQATIATPSAPSQRPRRTTSRTLSTSRRGEGGADDGGSARSPTLVTVRMRRGCRSAPPVLTGVWDGKVEEGASRISENEDQMTHRSPSRNEVDLIQHVDQMLVRLLLPQVLDDRLTPCSERISSIENMDDDVRRVEHLVQLSPNSARSAFGIDRFTGGGGGRMVYFRIGRNC